MKIRKSLLQAMFIGASLATITSCSLTDVVETEIVNAEGEVCQENGESGGKEYNCPACGMG